MERKGERQLVPKTPKREGLEERREFCRWLGRKDKIKPFVMAGSQSKETLESLVKALERQPYDPLFLFNCLGVSAFDVLYEIEVGRRDIAHRRKLRLSLNNKAKRTADIQAFKKAVCRVRLYEEFLNDEICADYELRLARTRIIGNNNKTTALPYSISGRLKALCGLLENPADTLKRLWLVDKIQNRSPKKGAPNKDEVGLAITNVIHECRPIFRKPRNSKILSWDEQQAVLKMKWPLLTAILTYAFPKGFTDPTDKHRTKTVKQRQKRDKNRGTKATLDEEQRNRAPKHAIRAVRESYKQQIKEWHNAKKKISRPLTSSVRAFLAQWEEDEETNGKNDKVDSF